MAIGMKCEEIEGALITGDAKATAQVTHDVRAHLKDCQSCREYARMVELPSATALVDAAQIERLQKMIASDLRPVRRLLPSWVLLAAFLFIFAGMSLIGTAYLGPVGWFMLLPVQKIAVFATLAASAALLSFALAKQMVPGERWFVRPLLLPAGLFVLLALIVASVFQVRADPHFLQAGLRCLRVGGPYAIPAAVIFCLILRRGAIMSPRTAGAIAGALAGLISTTVLEAHCADLNLWHILVWHAGISVLGSMAGFLIATIGEAVQDRLS